MKLSIGIVGLPNVGKSTLFKSLTHNDVHIANYPFATIDPNVGVVEVPDERLKTLTEMSKSKKTIPAIVEFYDIAGLVKGASQGQGLGNQFLSHIREVQVIAHVVRCFSREDIIHVDQTISPIRDIDVIETELILKDLETVEKRLIKAESDARGGDKTATAFRDALKEIKQELDNGHLLFASQNYSNILPPSHKVSEGHGKNIGIVKELKELGLLTAKPQLFVLNGIDTDVSDELKKKIVDMGSEWIVLDLSSETIDLSPLIKQAYSLLGLISFFTTGEDETRAWTICKNEKAPQAAGAIHTDFENKFIRAEVVAYDDFVVVGGWNQAKQKGKLRVEGKDYEVKDGDIITVRHG
jgi:hypothetical protein